MEQIGHKYVAIWQKIEVKSELNPYPRTSHTCVAYKNRYLVILGGETETKYITQRKGGEVNDLSAVNEDSDKISCKSSVVIGKEADEDVVVELEKEPLRSSNKRFSQPAKSSQSSQIPKESLSDVWIFDTFL